MHLRKRGDRCINLDRVREFAVDAPGAQVAIFAFEDLDAGDGAGDGTLRTGNGSGD